MGREFWQGRETRLQDHLRYSLQDAQSVREWLAP
jgi:pyridoxine/pyridoxamine 5'-phosphate oxidase